MYDARLWRVIAQELLELVSHACDMIMGETVGFEKSILPGHDIPAKSGVEFQNQSHIFRCRALREVDAIELFLVIGKCAHAPVRQHAGQHEGNEGNDGCQKQLALDGQVIEKPDDALSHDDYDSSEDHPKKASQEMQR
jgi:hypothetical protein